MFLGVLCLKFKVLQTRTTNSLVVEEIITKAHFIWITKLSIKYYLRNSFVKLYAFVELPSLEDYLSPTSFQCSLFIPLKRAEIERFCDLFKGYKNGTLESNELSSEEVFDWKWFRCYERNEGILKYWVSSGIFRLLAEIEVNWKLKNIFWIFVKAF